MLCDTSERTYNTLERSVSHRFEYADTNYKVADWKFPVMFHRSIYPPYS